MGDGGVDDRALLIRSRNAYTHLITNSLGVVVGVGVFAIMPYPWHRIYRCRTCRRRGFRNARDRRHPHAHVVPAGKKQKKTATASHSN